MTNPLVSVIRHKIGTEEEVNAVNARDLWSELESKQEFSTWIKKRIDDYDFTQGVDFSQADKFIAVGNSSAKRKITEYIISLDMAKELAMVERNEKGKQARRYFIECEKKSKVAIQHEEAYIAGFRKYFMLDVPMTWEKIYPDSFFTALMRLHGHDFTGNSSTPTYCSKIIHDWIYSIVLPIEIHKEVNSSSGTEKRHQWFSQQGGRKILADQIDKVETIAMCSSSRAEFERSCKKILQRPKLPTIITA